MHRSPEQSDLWNGKGTWEKHRLQKKGDSFGLKKRSRAEAVGDAGDSYSGVTARKLFCAQTAPCCSSKGGTSGLHTNRQGSLENPANKLKRKGRKKYKRKTSCRDHSSFELGKRKEKRTLRNAEAIELLAQEKPGTIGPKGTESSSTKKGQSKVKG